MKIAHDFKDAGADSHTETASTRHTDMFIDIMWPDDDADDDLGIEFCQRIDNRGRRVSPAMADM